MSSSPPDDDSDDSGSRYKGWTRPGPRPPGGVDVEDGESLDFLSGHWRIFQLQKGHRFSVDDVLCASYASSYAPRVERACDLGSGIGSVALTTAWRLPGARFVTIEAQDVSRRLAHKSARYNLGEGYADRFRILAGDIRDDAVLAEAAAFGPFDLVTGSPPYWPVGAALASEHAQAVPARLEVRGDVFDYAKAAARLLAPGGVFALVHQASQRQRVLQALDDAGLACLRLRDVCFKEGVPAATSGITLFAACKKEHLPRSFGEAFQGTRPGKPVVDAPLILRTTSGGVHPDYAALRVSYGFPTGDSDPDER